MKKMLCCLIIALFVSAAASYGQKVEKEGKQWLNRNTAPPEVNVNGLWNAKEWGKVTLNQTQGSNEVTGKGDGWDINGIVSGKQIFLLFSHHGRVNYTAVLTATGEKKMEGDYTRGMMKENSKKKGMLLIKT